MNAEHRFDVRILNQKTVIAAWLVGMTCWSLGLFGLYLAG